ncbi:MAG: tRNA 2-methylthio-N6-isopentenyl adenosine(37) hydroxylase MiaE [Phycisphaerales bacterium]|nr:MAG: tRNA 2-methylthio-N6-isopentenyl adenosine(37) hydroxylase MiaE [Phycisphaerales bacterium]
MDAVIDIETLPLRYQTPPDWAVSVLSEPLKLLNDHAHLEKKAASNALELLNRWPDPRPPENWVQAMTAVARDEVEHLAVVTRLLARRGGKLTRFHKNAYAAALRNLVSLGAGRRELVDRLLVSALIELRSCERFALLAMGCRDDDELALLYRGLWSSERGHYRVFLELAREVGVAAGVEERWSDLLDAEAAIIRDQPSGPRMHSGVE